MKSFVKIIVSTSINVSANYFSNVNIGNIRVYHDCMRILRNEYVTFHNDTMKNI